MSLVLEIRGVLAVPSYAGFEVGRGPVSLLPLLAFLFLSVIIIGRGARVDYLKEFPLIIKHA